MGQVSFFITIQWNAVGSVPDPITFSTDPDPAHFLVAFKMLVAIIKFFPSFSLLIVIAVLIEQ